MSAVQTKSLYARTLTDRIAIRRYAGSGTGRVPTDTPARAKVAGYTPHELIAGSGILQGDRKIILFAQDLVDRQFALPVMVTDKAVVRGRELAILAADDNTHRDGGELIAIELQVRG